MRPAQPVQLERPVLFESPVIERPVVERPVLQRPVYETPVYERPARIPAPVVERAVPI